MKVYKKNAIYEVINNPNKIKKIYLSELFKDKNFLDVIKNNNIQYEKMSQAKMNKIEPNNQGIIAIIDDFEYSDYKEMLNDKIIIILDHLEDPHNLGAIIRTVESAGIKSIIIPKDRSVSVNETVMKTSTGALNYVNIARVTNLNNLINELKNNGYFIYGAEANGKDYKNISYSDKVALIIGSEGSGLSPLVRKNCDEIVSLPMKGKVNSLNASVAAGILIYDLISR